MKQYPISREDFCKIIHKVVPEDYMETFLDCMYEEEDTGSFIYYYGNDETVYILHKDSGVVVSWYKPIHLGRCLECNADMSLKQWEDFFRDLFDEMTVNTISYGYKPKFRYDFSNMKEEK